jgi:ribosome-associated protein
MAETIAIGDRAINLTQVLKLVGCADTGGHAKAIIGEGLVRVNGEVELRKRRKMAVGDRVDVEGAGSWSLSAE